MIKVNFAKAEDIVIAILDSIKTRGEMPKQNQKEFYGLCEHTYYEDYEDIGAVMGDQLIDAFEIIINKELIKGLGLNKSGKEYYPTTIPVIGDKLEITDRGIEYLELNKK